MSYMNRSGGRRRVKVRRRLQRVCLTVIGRTCRCRCKNHDWWVARCILVGSAGLNSQGWLHPRADSVDAGCRTSEHITQHAKFSR